MQGRGYVNGQLAVEAEMMAQIVKDKPKIPQRQPKKPTATASMSISKLAYIHPDAKLGKDVTVEPFASIYARCGDRRWQLDRSQRCT